jgi:hypothetical protein
LSISGAFGECRASRWFDSGEELASVMGRIACQGGRTQIGKVLSAALKAADQDKVAALVYVGDCMEEDVDALCDKAGRLGLLGVPMFLFQEGRDSVAEKAFAEMARLTRGAHCRFDAGSGASACRAAEGGCRLCLRRTGGAGGAGKDRRAGCAPAPGTDQAGQMIYLLLGTASARRAGVFRKPFRSANPAALAGGLRTLAGLALLALAAVFALTGRIILAVPLFGLGLSVLGIAGLSRLTGGYKPQKASGQRSRVRTAMVEMELDHDTGEMSGRCWPAAIRAAGSTTWKSLIWKRSGAKRRRTPRAGS